MSDARCKLRALDLFCKAGGATRGLQQAGFHVTGIDNEPQPNYCGDHFVQANAFNRFDWGSYDLIWASPPCQGRTAYKRRPNHVRDVDTDGAIERVRAMLRESGRPYIIENVAGAPLESPLKLCGSMFGDTMQVRRHRYFEINFHAPQPECRHWLQQGDYPQATNRANRRKTIEIGVYRIPLATQQAAMGINWMTLDELSNAIPPAYSQWLAQRFLAERAANADQLRYAR